MTKNKLSNVLTGLKWWEYLIWSFFVLLAMVPMYAIYLGLQSLLQGRTAEGILVSAFGVFIILMFVLDAVYTP